jgi:hypothetical protein
MNKSTPIAQLPSNTLQNNNFINEQQRQFITQAQQAISNSPMPQNTQMSSDIANDDDIVVQDILNQINASSSNEQGNSGQDQGMNMNAINQQLMMQQLAAQQQQNMVQSSQMPQNMQYPPQALYQMSQMGYGGPMENSIVVQGSQPLDFKTYLFHFADDVKLAGIVFVVVILVHFIPLDKLISKYFAVDKIPYHDIILRAIMAALFVIIIKKLSKI